MTDLKKLEIFDKMLVKRGLSKPRSLEQWLYQTGVSFNRAGDSIPSEIYTLDNTHSVQVVANGSEAEVFLTMVMEAMTGSLVFTSQETEEVFWRCVASRCKDEFKIELPRILMPKNLKMSE